MKADVVAVTMLAAISIERDKNNVPTKLVATLPAGSEIEAGSTAQMANKLQQLFGGN